MMVDEILKATRQSKCGLCATGKLEMGSVF